MGSPKEVEFTARINDDGTITYGCDREDDVALATIDKLQANHPSASFDTSTAAGQIARALAPQLRKILRPTQVPPDDAYVDQDAGLFPREVYLRLARKGYFKVKKEGHFRFARWADVKAGFEKAGRTDITVVTETDDPEADILNAIRQRAGLQVKGGR